MPFAPKRPAPVSTRPNPVSRPATTMTGDTATGRGRSRFAEMSLARFIATLPEVAQDVADSRRKTVEHIAAARADIIVRATAAAEDQPVATPVAEELYSIAAHMQRIQEEVASRMAALQKRAELLQAMARRQNEADLTRLNSPRKGSHTVEARADVTSAKRDM